MNTLLITLITTGIAATLVVIVSSRKKEAKKTRWYDLVKNKKASRSDIDYIMEHTDQYNDAVYEIFKTVPSRIGLPNFKLVEVIKISQAFHDNLIRAYSYKFEGDNEMAEIYFEQAERSYERLVQINEAKRSTSIKS